MAENGEGLNMELDKKGQTLLPVLVDTPVWQKYFLKKDRTYREVNALMDAGRVCCVDLVVAELLYTAETQEEISVIQDFTRIFPVLQESPGIWEEAARLALRLRHRGKKLSLRDCYVAIMAQSHGVLLFTTNPCLRQARRAAGLEFLPEGRTSE